MRAATASEDFDDNPDIPDDDGDADLDFKKPIKDELTFDLTPYIPQNASKIPTRKWLYGTAYIRKFIGLTAATGGAGKSSLILLECVAMACGKDLLGVEPAEKLRVLYWNGEDPLEELERRVAGILKYYGLTKADLGSRLFIKSGRDMPIRIAELDQGKAKIAKPMTRAMDKAVRDHKLDVVAIDPFVSSHGVPENDNNAIELVAKKWADIADKTNCAVVLSHHTRKTNGMGASIEDSRGASALNYAARTRRAINTMTAAEAKAAGFKDDDRSRLSYFKADMMGSSMIKPTAALDWYRFEPVNLMNGPPDELTGESTEGDSVGVVVKWEYQKLTLELDADSARDAVAALNVDGPWRYDGRAAKWAGLAIARSAQVEVTDLKVKAQIAALIEEWIKDGTLEKYSGTDGNQRKEKVFVRPALAEDDDQLDFG
nr:AAA family ATPase [Bradyrhizobium sp. 76]